MFVSSVPRWAPLDPTSYAGRDGSTALRGLQKGPSFFLGSGLSSTVIPSAVAALTPWARRQAALENRRERGAGMKLILPAYGVLCLWEELPVMGTPAGLV